MPKPSVSVLLQRLRKAHPSARYELDWETPVQLLVATILAAQCRDSVVNQVTKKLFPKYPDAKAFANADLAELEAMVRSTGTYKVKAKSIRGACARLVESFGGQVPRRMEDMLTLPGVQRKTANVVLNSAYDIASGVIVDTHVARVSQRLGLSTETKPDAIERDLMEVVPQRDWTFFGPAMVLHGRYVCTAKGPKCGGCIFEDLCDQVGVDVQGSPAVSHDDVPMETDLFELPASWRHVLRDEIEKPYFHQLRAFVEAERRDHEVFPPARDMFSALELTAYDKVKVLLLGQDPYHDVGQAHGLCFSVRPGIKPPPSLVNMFKELRDDLGVGIASTGYLVPWAKQGILMLNAVLTVRAHEPNSHKDRGWEQLTDAILSKVNDKSEPVVFVLWGSYAQKKAKLIDDSRHIILKAAHPSPLSAKLFMGSKPFSGINQALRNNGQRESDWTLGG